MRPLSFPLSLRMHSQSRSTRVNCDLILTILKMNIRKSILERCTSLCYPFPWAKSIIFSEYILYGPILDLRLLVFLPANLFLIIINISMSLICKMHHLRCNWCQLTHRCLHHHRAPGIGKMLKVLGIMRCMSVECLCGRIICDGPARREGSNIFLNLAGILSSGWM